MWAVPDRWDPSRGHRGISRVEIWAGGVVVDSTDDIIDGSVVEKNVTGIRSNLTLSVEPSRQWLDWLALPGVSLRPFSGMQWGTGDTGSAECPLGVFPVDPPTLTLPADAIQVQVNDLWQRVVQADFLYARFSPRGDIRSAAAGLIDEVGVGTTIVTASRGDGLPPLLWDKSRHETIAGLVDSIGAEAFWDRLGRPVLQDVTTQVGADLVDGENGTVVTVSSSADWSQVVNQIAVTSSNNDVVFPPAVVSITDPDHPAHEWRIGARTLKVSSPLLLTRDQAFAMGWSLLQKKSAPALSWSVSCVPDPSRQPGDVINVTTGLGAVRAVVQEVHHPLGDGPQTIVLGAVL